MYIKKSRSEGNHFKRDLGKPPYWIGHWKANMRFCSKTKILLSYVTHTNYFTQIQYVYINSYTHTHTLIHKNIKILLTICVKKAILNGLTLNVISQESEN